MHVLAALLCLLADDHAVVRELTDLLAIPNLADDTANINRNADSIKAMMEKRGIVTRVLTLDGAPPVVVGDIKAPGATRTIAFYAHYDGQPVDASQWKTPPWTPVMRDASGNEVDWQNAKALDPEWRIYARSASDDKAPIVAMMAALDRLRAKNAKPRFNLRFVFEGEEEAGSPHLAAYIAKYPDALRPDAWIICDGPVHQSRRAQLAFGARGVLSLDLVVYGPSRGLHSGHYGNWVPNPIVALTHLLDSMRDENGRILIDGFYDDVVPATPAEKAAIAAMPPVEADLKRELLIARTEGELLNERILLPALNVSGIQAGGVGEKASNTIQTSARAAIDFRLVPAQTPESVQTKVEKHLVAHGWTIVRDDPDAATRLSKEKIVRVRWGSGYPPSRTPLDLPLSQEIAALMTRAGREPVRLPTMGGSVPIHLFQEPDNTPAIVLPIANHDNNQHSANENLRLKNLWDAIDVFAALFEGLTAAPLPPPVAIAGTNPGTSLPAAVPLRVGGDVRPPVLVKRVEPKYPEEARQAGFSSVVLLELVIDKTGRVSKASVLHQHPYGLDQAAIDAVKQWEYKPGTLRDKPVDIIWNVSLNFALPEK